MGLDVVHYRATHNATAKRILVANWAQACNVPIDAFAGYITDVPTTEKVSTLYIFENEKHLNKARRVAGDLNAFERFLLRSDTPDLEAALRHIAEQLGVLYEDTEMYESATRGVRPYHFAVFHRRTQSKGVFLEEVGNQHNGIDGRFHNLFRVYPFYRYFGLLWDFQRASVCVRESTHTTPDGEDDSARVQANFKRDFLDTFEEGRSLLLV